MAKGKDMSNEEIVINGRVTYSVSGRPAVGVRVTVMDVDLLSAEKLGETKTGKEGNFKIVFGVKQFRERFKRTPDVYLLIHDERGRLLTTTRDAVVRNAGTRQEIHVQLSGSGPDDEELPTIRVGVARVKRRAFEKLRPETVLKIAEVAVRRKGRKDPRIIKTLEELSPELSPERLRREFCGTLLVLFLEETIRVKEWPREIRVRLEEILTGYNPEAGYASYDTTNFSITYQTSGSDQPPSTDTGGNITMPGTGAVVGTTTGGNGIPDYIEKLGF